jgi:predicted GH43/DUF377 family glycosyl hydrolase
MKIITNLLIFGLFIFFSTTSIAQIDWIKYPDNPILVRGALGTWDDESVGLACVIQVGDLYHLWYDANWNTAGTVNAGIGHATSLDGIHWVKDTLNPVLIPEPSNSWEDFCVSQVSVIFNSSDSKFHMWYTGWGSATEPGYFGHATSSDGSLWERDPENPVLSTGGFGSWDDADILAPSVILVNDTLHMWYDGYGGGDVLQIGHATSVDGISWDKDSDYPVLKRSDAGRWDYPHVRDSRVIHDGSGFHMFYTGGEWLSYDIGYAYSEDGKIWTKYNDPSTTSPLYIDSDPVIEKGSAGEWDDDAVLTGSVLLNATGDSLKIWYTGADNGVTSLQIGYATCLFDPSSLNEFNQVLPRNFDLSQNYPNPFNPVTMITYQLPMINDVDLSIYNVLGQKVGTLVNERKQAGDHQVEWDASGFASGVYYYRIEAGEFVDVKKMVLLR